MHAAKWLYWVLAIVSLICTVLLFFADLQAPKNPDKRGDQSIGRLVSEADTLRRNTLLSLPKGESNVLHALLEDQERIIRGLEVFRYNKGESQTALFDSLTLILSTIAYAVDIRLQQVESQHQLNVLVRDSELALTDANISNASAHVAVLKNNHELSLGLIDRYSTFDERVLKQRFDYHKQKVKELSAPELDILKVFYTHAIQAISLPNELQKSLVDLNRVNIMALWLDYTTSRDAMEPSGRSVIVIVVSFWCLVTALVAGGVALKLHLHIPWDILMKFRALTGINSKYSHCAMDRRDVSEQHHEKQSMKHAEDKLDNSPEGKIIKQQSFDVNQVLKRIIGRQSHTITTKISISEQKAIVTADLSDIEYAFELLLSGAWQAAKHRGRDGRVSVRSRVEGENAKIVIQDNGRPLGKCDGDTSGLPLKNRSDRQLPLDERFRIFKKAVHILENVGGKVEVATEEKYGSYIRVSLLCEASSLPVTLESVSPSVSRRTSLDIDSHLRRLIDDTSSRLSMPSEIKHHILKSGLMLHCVPADFTAVVQGLILHVAAIQKASGDSEREIEVFWNDRNGSLEVSIIDNARPLSQHDYVSFANRRIRLMQSELVEANALLKRYGGHFELHYNQLGCNNRTTILWPLDTELNDMECDTVKPDNTDFQNKILTIQRIVA